MKTESIMNRSIKMVNFKLFEMFKLHWRAEANSRKFPSVRYMLYANSQVHCLVSKKFCLDI